eukprot:scaffold9979_cov97-Skeletonema_marinoi.AAC.4
MAKYHESLEAVDCHVHSVRYDMVLESRASSRLRCLIWSPTTRVELAVVSDASSGRLRRCSDADTTKQGLSREKDVSIMANYHESLEAVDCHIHSVRYDMVLESRGHGRLRCLIWSPTTV